MTVRILGVVGLGYVGQPVVAAMANVGYRIIGMDIDADKVANLTATYEPTLYEPGLAETFARCRDRIRFTTSYEEVMRDSEAICITVGTPVDSNDQPVTAYLDTAIQNLGKYLRRGQTIILRSTVVPGTTIQMAQALEEISGLCAGKDFYVSFCPERTIEGIALHELYSLPNIIGGVDSESAVRTAEVMQKLGSSVITVSSSTVAELCKLADNVYRALNIAFANEFGTICESAHVDAYELLWAVNAAYPRTNIFRPGLGADGPCLSKDPVILRQFARSAGLATPLVDASVEVNLAATRRVALEVQKFLATNLIGRPRVAVLGLSFKGMPETDDLRGSPAGIIFEELVERNGQGFRTTIQFSFFDPIVQEFKGHKVERRLEDCLAGSNVILFLSDHPSLRNVPLETVLTNSARPLLIVDAWHNVSQLDRRELPLDVTYVRIGDGQ